MQDKARQLLTNGERPQVRGAPVLFQANIRFELDKGTGITYVNEKNLEGHL